MYICKVIVKNITQLFTKYSPDFCFTCSFQDLDEMFIQSLGRVRPMSKESKLNVDMLSAITSFLSLKEKAFVCRVSKTWLRASMYHMAMVINMDDVGRNLGNALSFVGERFNKLQDITLKIDPLSTYPDNILYLHGYSLRDFWEGNMLTF